MRGMKPAFKAVVTNYIETNWTPKHEHEYLRETAKREKIAVAHLQAMMSETLIKQREAMLEARRFKELAKHIKLELVDAEESYLRSVLELDEANMTAELDWQAESAAPL